MNSIFYSVLAILLFISCTKKETCPPDEVLGSLSLQAESRDFLPYAGVEAVEFINDTGTIAYLKDPNKLISDSSKTIIENICLEEVERADKYYLSEHKTINFYDLDTSRKFRIIGNLSIVEDYLADSSTLSNPVLYDELKLTVHRSNPSLSGAVATIEFVASDRGNLNRLSDTIIYKINKYKLIPHIKIDTFNYDNVYEVRNNSNDTANYYFKPLKGVVAFRDLNNHWWNLYRVH